MKVILYIFLSSILVYAESSQQKEVAVETLLELYKKSDGLDLDFIDGIQQLLDKAKNAIRTKSLRKNSNERLKFTDFVENAVLILKTYNDEDLQKVFDILDEEIHKYHYEGCKIHELTEKYAIRRFISDKLDSVKKTTPKKIRKDLDIILKTLQERKYDGKDAELIRFLNSIYGTESTLKLATILNNLQQYQANTRKSYLDLLSILRNGIRSAIFDHYSNLRNNVRKELKLRLESYWTDSMNNKINHQVIEIGGSKVKSFHSFEFTTPKSSLDRLIPTLSETEVHVTKKKHKRKRKERHRVKKDKHDMMTTEGIFESIPVDKNVDINSGRIMTLYPEPIKKKHKTATIAFKTHSDDARDSPHPLYRSVVKRHRKKHKKRRESTKKLKHSKEILRSHYTVERHGGWDTVDKNTKRVKSTTIKHKTKNREVKKPKHEKRKKEKAANVEEKSSRSNEDKPKVKHVENNVLRSKKRGTKKSMSEENRKVTAQIGYNDRDDFADTSSFEDYPKTMRFRNMDAESNEGMSIEGFITPGFFYRKSNYNNTFVNSEAKKKEIEAKIPDKGLINQLDYLEKQLQAVKIKIANQRDLIPNFVTEKTKYTIDSNRSESTETTKWESNNSSEIITDTSTTKPLSTKSRITKVKSSTSSGTTTQPVSKVTASTTTVKLTKVTNDATTVITKENEINETHKEKPRVIMKKTSDYFVIPNSENLLNTTVPSYLKIDVDKNDINKEIEKNLRKTGLQLDDSVDNFVNNKNKTVVPLPLTKLDLQKALFNDSTMLHEDKEKDLLIKKTVNEDLNKIFGAMPDGKMDFQMPNFDINYDKNNSILNNRRSLGSVVGKHGLDPLPPFDINNFKDPFSGDLDI